ncbi:toxin-antitoxin system HicB family antitoxin [Brucella anthropi]|nr:toxin-antitoxin system HicB family antitoxin [Brucella anthropi]
MSSDAFCNKMSGKFRVRSMALLHSKIHFAALHQRPCEDRLAACGPESSF